MRTYNEETITPEIAREYLTYNTHNRPIKDDRVFMYAEQMGQGKWRPNGEAIKFGTTYRQGRAVNVLVWRSGGSSPEAFPEAV